MFTLLAVALLVTNLGGCIFIDAGEDEDATSRSDGTRVNEGSGSKKGSGSTKGSGRDTSDRTDLRDVSHRDVAGFLSPSRNIACALLMSEHDDEPYARCEIKDRAWDPVPVPDGCENGGGYALFVGTNSEVVCITDTIREWHEAGTDGSVVLPYGSAMRMDDITCTSQKSGVRCSNTRTGRGFSLAKSQYSLF